MTFCRSAAVLSLFTLSGWAIASAAADELPPVAGELTGELVVTRLAGAPPLAWKLVLNEGEDSGERLAEFVLEAPGLKLRGCARMRTLANGFWQIDESRIDATSWFPILTRGLEIDQSKVEAAGVFVVTGSGRFDAGEISGRLQFEWREGALRAAERGWSIEGIALEGVLGSVPSLASEGVIRLGFRELTAAGLVARDGALEFAIDAEGAVSVIRADSEFMGGRVRLAPFGFRRGQQNAETGIAFERINLERIATLLPPVLSSAEGRVNGRMVLEWSAAGGFRPGIGKLEIDPGQPASVRLSAAPGFLTSRVSERLLLLPDWLGPLARALAPVNPVYETLRAIEMGEMKLEVDALDIGLRPEGDATGRTARVILTARPTSTDVVESVRFEVNVAGPLVDVLRLGMEGRLDVRAR